MKTLIPQLSQDRRGIYYRTQVRPHGQKYPHFHWASIEVFLGLIYTYHRLGDSMEKLFNEYGLSRAGFNALMILGRSRPEGCIQQDLSQYLLVSRANITGIINGLVRQGLASRNEHPGDKRARVVRISKKGEDLLAALIPRYHKKIKMLLAFLTPSQKVLFKKLLERIQLGIEKSDKKKADSA